MLCRGPIPAHFVPVFSPDVSSLLESAWALERVHPLPFLLYVDLGFPGTPHDVSSCDWGSDEQGDCVRHHKQVNLSRE